MAYLYQHEPTLASDKLHQFDIVDQQTRLHSLFFGLENKLQTKRKGKSVDLVRLLVGTDFKLKEDPGKGGFNNVTSDLEVKPFDWLSFYMDTKYDTIADHISTINFDLYINGDADRWYWKLGKRLNYDVDDILTSEWGWKINQKWRFKFYQQFNTQSGYLKEQEYSFRRDLHEWWMDVNFRQTRTEGNEIWLVFTLKAFPEGAFDFGTSFSQRKPGSGIEP